MSQMHEFMGWARLRMLSSLQRQKAAIGMSDAMVAAEMKKNFPGIEIPPTKEVDDMMVGRDFIQPNPQPIVVMPQNSAVGAVVATLLAVALATLLAAGVWYFASHQPVGATPTPTVSSDTDYDIGLFTP